MAENILKLKVDSTEYENKLKRASSRLLQMEADCKKVGGTMAIAEKEDIAFAKSLGQMETQAKTAKGRLAELNNAFVDLASYYKRMTDEEKASPYGQAMAKSIEQLKGRVIDAKQSLSEINSETQKSNGVLSELSSALGINIGSLTKFASASAVVTGALKVAKDAFFSTEAGVDEWGRTVEAATSSYNAFCQALATGSFDTFFTNLGNIISRAKEAYNALDNLKTVGGIISNQEAMLNSKRAKDLKIIKDPKATQAQKDAARADLSTIQQQKGAAINQTKELNNEYIKKALRNQAGVLTDAEYNKYYSLIVRSFYDSAAKDALDQVKINHVGTHAISDGSGHYSYQKTVSQINVGDLFTDKFREGLNPYIQAYWNADTRRYSDERADNRLMGNGGKGTGGKGGTSGKTKDTVSYINGSIGDIEQKISELQKKLKNTTDNATYITIQSQIDNLNKAKDAITNTIAENSIKDLESKMAEQSKIINETADATARKSAQTLYNEYAKNIKRLKDIANGGYGVEDGENGYSSSILQGISNQVNASLNKKKGKKISLDGADDLESKGKKAAMAWQEAASSVASVGSALQGINNPAAKVFGIIAEAIANVAGGFAAALASSKTGKLSVWAWIAEAAAGTATMISTIAAIKSATSGNYANGGIIPGNNVSGDNLRVYGMNSGELVLNRAQQGNLASQLESNNAFSNLHLETTIREDKLIVMLNNGLRKHGRGTLVTTR